MADNISVHEVPSRLFKYLRQMDREALNKSYYRGRLYPTGLREYHNHRFPNLDPSLPPDGIRCEDEWCRRLAELFGADGVPVDLFSPYGDGRKGDLRIRCQGGDSLWIEVKGAWRYNLDPVVAANCSYAKHLTSPTEGVPKDFLKLACVDCTFASHVGILVIGFDAPAHGLVTTESDLVSMKQAAKFNSFTWSEHRDEWPDGIVADSRARCWFWYRPAGAQAAIATLGISAANISSERRAETAAIGPPSDAVVKRLRDFIRRKDELLGNRWEWGDCYVEPS